jgi:hypothetical protein
MRLSLTRSLGSVEEPDPACVVLEAYRILEGFSGSPINEFGLAPCARPSRQSCHQNRNVRFPFRGSGEPETKNIAVMQ